MEPPSLFRSALSNQTRHAKAATYIQCRRGWTALCSALAAENRGLQAKRNRLRRAAIKWRVVTVARIVCWQHLEAAFEATIVHLRSRRLRSSLRRWQADAVLRAKQRVCFMAAWRHTALVRIRKQLRIWHEAAMAAVALDVMLGSLRPREWIHMRRKVRHWAQYSKRLQTHAEGITIRQRHQTLLTTALAALVGAARSRGHYAFVSNAADRFFSRRAVAVAMRVWRRHVVKFRFAAALATAGSVKGRAHYLTFAFCEWGLFAQAVRRQGDLIGLARSRTVVLAARRRLEAIDAWRSFARAREFVRLALAGSNAAFIRSLSRRTWAAWATWVGRRRGLAMAVGDAQHQRYLSLCGGCVEVWRRVSLARSATRRCASAITAVATRHRYRAAMSGLRRAADVGRLAMKHALWAPLGRAFRALIMQQRRQKLMAARFASATAHALISALRVWAGRVLLYPAAARRFALERRSAQKALAATIQRWAKHAMRARQLATEGLARHRAMIKRRVRGATHIWKVRAAAEGHLLKRTAVVTTRVRSRVLRAAYLRWIARTAMARRRRMRNLDILLSLGFYEMRVVLNTWQDAVAAATAMQRRKRLEGEAFVQLELYKVRRAMNAWQDTAVEERRRVDRTLWFRVSRTSRVVCHSIRVWRELAVTKLHNRIQREAARVFAGRAAVGVWHAAAIARAIFATRLAAASMRLTLRRMASIISHWHRAALGRRAWRRLSAKSDGHRIGRTIAAWISIVVATASFVCRCNALGERGRFRPKHSALLTWKSNAVAEAEGRRKRRALGPLACIVALRRKRAALSKWRLFSSHALAFGRSADSTAIAMQRRTYAYAWRCFTSPIAEHKNLLRCAREWLKRMASRAWSCMAKHAVEQRQQRRLMASAVKAHCARGRTTAIYAWTAWVARRRISRHQLAAVATSRQRRAAARVLWKMREAAALGRRRLRLPQLKQQYNLGGGSTVTFTPHLTGPVSNLPSLFLTGTFQVLLGRNYRRWVVATRRTRMLSITARCSPATQHFSRASIRLWRRNSIATAAWNSFARMHMARELAPRLCAWRRMAKFSVNHQLANRISRRRSLCLCLSMWRGYVNTFIVEGELAWLAWSAGKAAAKAGAMRRWTARYCERTRLSALSRQLQASRSSTECAQVLSSLQARTALAHRLVQLRVLCSQHARSRAVRGSFTHWLVVKASNKAFFRLVAGRGGRAMAARRRHAIDWAMRRWRLVIFGWVAAAQLAPLSSALRRSLRSTRAFAHWRSMSVTGAAAKHVGASYDEWAKRSKCRRALSLWADEMAMSLRVNMAARRVRSRRALATLRAAANEIATLRRCQELVRFGRWGSETHYPAHAAGVCAETAQALEHTLPESVTSLLEYLPASPMGEEERRRMSTRRATWADRQVATLLLSRGRSFVRKSVVIRCRVLHASKRALLSRRAIALRIWRLGTSDGEYNRRLRSIASTAFRTCLGTLRRMREVVYLWRLSTRLSLQRRRSAGLLLTQGQAASAARGMLSFKANARRCHDEREMRQRADLARFGQAVSDPRLPSNAPRKAKGPKHDSHQKAESVELWKTEMGSSGLSQTRTAKTASTALAVGGKTQCDRTVHVHPLGANIRALPHHLHMIIVPTKARLSFSSSEVGAAGSKTPVVHCPSAVLCTPNTSWRHPHLAPPSNTSALSTARRVYTAFARWHAGVRSRCMLHVASLVCNHHAAVRVLHVLAAASARRVQLGVTQAKAYQTAQLVSTRHAMGLMHQHAIRQRSRTQATASFRKHLLIPACILWRSRTSLAALCKMASKFSSFTSVRVVVKVWRRWATARRNREAIAATFRHRQHVSALEEVWVMWRWASARRMGAQRAAAGDARVLTFVQYRRGLDAFVAAFTRCAVLERAEALWLTYANVHNQRVAREAFVRWAQHSLVLRSVGGRSATTHRSRPPPLPARAVRFAYECAITHGFDAWRLNTKHLRASAQAMHLTDRSRRRRIRRMFGRWARLMEDFVQPARLQRGWAVLTDAAVGGRHLRLRRYATLARNKRLRLAVLQRWAESAATLARARSLCLRGVMEGNRRSLNLVIRVLWQAKSEGRRLRKSSEHARLRSQVHVVCDAMHTWVCYWLTRAHVSTLVSAGIGASRERTIKWAFNNWQRHAFHMRRRHLLDERSTAAKWRPTVAKFWRRWVNKRLEAASNACAAIALAATSIHSWRKACWRRWQDTVIVYVRERRVSQSLAKVNTTLALACDWECYQSLELPSLLFCVDPCLYCAGLCE